MKRIILTLAIVLAATIANAKEASLAGIPVKGTVAEFAGEIKKKGFAESSSSNGIITLTGSYGGYDKCKIKIYAGKGGSGISKVVLCYPECADWACLTTNYYALKDSLAKEYGGPTGSVERFFSYEGADEKAPSNEGIRLLRLVQDRCEFKTTYKADDAEVLLYLTRRGQFCYVAVEVKK